MFPLVLGLGFAGVLLAHKTEVRWMFSAEICLLQSVLSCVLCKCLMVNKAGGR